MGYLLPALTEKEFQNQRDVVLHDGRQNYENAVRVRRHGDDGALYPPDHPPWLTIGRPQSARARSLRMSGLCQPITAPQCVSGARRRRVRTDDALQLPGGCFFGSIIGRSALPVDATRPEPPAREVRLLLEDRVELPRLYLAWHSEGLFAAGDAEMDLVAELLAGSKTSRLYRTLVYDQRIATEIAASQNSREIGGFFQVVATAAPRRTLQTSRPHRDHQRSRPPVASGPTPAEMERGLAQAESHFIYRLQTVGGFGGKSDQLNAYNVFLGDPDYFDKDLDRYRRMSAQAIQAEAGRLLHPNRRIALSVVPKGRTELALDGSVQASVS
jgi:zinc protease